MFKWEREKGKGKGKGLTGAGGGRHSADGYLHERRSCVDTYIRISVVQSERVPR